jgi:hypothetical protein
LSYYVNPDGNEIIELGTRQYPYKNIALTFIEILNFHSHSERTVNVYLKEYTTNYMNHRQNYVINMTKVHIESYTDTITSPNRAIIYAVENTLAIFNTATVMNLIINSTLNLSEKIGVDGITENEKALLSVWDSTFYTLRSSLSFNNIDVFRDITTQNMKKSYFIKAVYLQEKMVTVTNMNFQISGFILYTVDPMSLYAENLYVDFHASMGGFVMRIDCNYPEAYVDGTIFINNCTVENAQERTASLMEGFLMHDSSQMVTVNDTRILIYGSTYEDRGPIEKQFSAN